MRSEEGCRVMRSDEGCEIIRIEEGCDGHEVRREVK